ncbi:hypothetical protein SDJN03_07459, partial [Cucurbita argyrosperma subsp. sororia]
MIHGHVLKVHMFWQVNSTSSETLNELWHLILYVRSFRFINTSYKVYVVLKSLAGLRSDSGNFGFSMVFSSSLVIE